MIRLVTLLMLVGVLSLPAYARESRKEVKNPPAAVSDSSSKSMSFGDVISWPFIHVVQPVFGFLVYPVTAPLQYVFDNGVPDKAVELITFGKRKNILIYPVFNLKPGSSAMIGVCYRHRNLFKESDYFVVENHFYANSDLDVKLRYSKQSLFGLKKLYGQTSLNMYWDRDNGFTLPGTQESFKQADTTFAYGLNFGFPITESRNLNFSFGTELIYHWASFTDTRDSILNDAKFPINDRGLYQGHFEAPVFINLVFDNLDYPYAPSRGCRLSIKASYVFTTKYDGIKKDDLARVGLDESSILGDINKNHDSYGVEAFYQVYFFIGKANHYVLSAKEGRETRKFYTDFSLNEALRVWRPENLVETLFERRVLAFQFRFVGMWEREKGHAPFSAFPEMNSRFPLRGYSDTWASPFLMGLSMEYRWPVDRLVDGVVFDEYGVTSDRVNHWSKKHLYNSWGFGVRVRKPDMFLFRMQFAFHGWHGIRLVMTVSPEFR